MPSRERVAALVQAVEERRELDAIRAFYAEDAQTQENQRPPTVGRAALLEKEAQFLATIVTMHAAHAVSYAVDGDRVAINWVFEWTNASGQRFRMDEIAYQLWEGDRIVREQYYYDTASLRVEPSV